VSETEDAITVIDHAERARYEVFVDGQLAGYAAYRDLPGRRAIVHAEVAEAFGGRGVGSYLARQALDDVRGRGLRVVPSCPFIEQFIDRHPAYQDLVGD